MTSLDLNDPRRPCNQPKEDPRPIGWALPKVMRKRGRLARRRQRQLDHERATRSPAVALAHGPKLTPALPGISESWKQRHRLKRMGWR